MNKSRYLNSQLFLVRLSAEPGTGGEIELCGKVQDVVTGEAYDFHGGQQLVDTLLGMVAQNRTSLPGNNSEIKGSS
jgi:hypothetical protein